MTGYLLDTHALLWWVDDDRRLGRRMREVLESEERVLASDVSLWELSIKTALGQFSFVPDVLTWFGRQLSGNRFGALSIARTHLAGVADLPMHHRDPFDRLLISQALAEDLTVITADQAFADYAVPTLW